MVEPFSLPWQAKNDPFSEFTYGFALTNELVSREPKIISPPIFPSLFKEGQAGGGYDVALDRPGRPLFLQFKLSQYMSRNSARECRLNEMKPRFYRMHLRSRKKSQQHVLLQELENSGLGDVFYCAPAFRTVGQLSDHYRQNRVESESRFVRPSELPVISDNENHWLSFSAASSGPTRFYSEHSQPVALKTLSLTAHAEKVLHAIPEDRSVNNYVVELAHWFDRLERVTGTLVRRESREARGHTPRSEPLDRVAIAAHTLLNCSFSIIQGRPI